MGNSAEQASTKPRTQQADSREDGFCMASVGLSDQALRSLSHLRAQSDLLAHHAEGRIWLRWPARLRSITQLIQALTDAKLLHPRAWGWCEGSSGFAVETPDLTIFQPLAVVIHPQALPEGDGAHRSNLPAAAKVELSIIPSTQQHPASAVLLPLTRLYALLRATPETLWKHLGVAWHKQQALVRTSVGQALRLDVPPQNSQRFWGERVLVPLGWQLSVDAAEPVTLRLIGAKANEIALVQHKGISLIPEACFAPASRAGLRLAIQGGEER